MRKRTFRFALTLVSSLAIAGSAFAGQNVNFWYNAFGDAPASQPPVINVISGGTATLSIYMRTSGIGPISGISLMFGYSTTGSQGTGATPNNTDATFNSFAWAQADLTSGSTTGQFGGGSGAGTRPYGYNISSLNLSSTFAGTGDGVDFKVADITLNINAAAGTDIPISIWANPPSDFFATSVVNGNNQQFFPAQAYNGLLHVNPVPEPASIAMLGLGALALIRRRRSNK